MITNFLYSSLDGNAFDRIMTCKLAKKIWDILEVTYEITFQIKKSKFTFFFITMKYLE